ncbi:zinc finger protein 62 homolog [Hylaeus volcanicus]|uniref:zinc finger protein 62 homolog n=1 Tax=Hylaeus volcanicus TaxID=313075 RepID=UPI0023B867C0|nr:zinc finger protein 62 homolog [Hylaeus volcanicus]
MDEVVELQDMENVCRLCLSTDEPKSSVFGMQDSPVPLVTKIQACLSIQISATDKLSKDICAECVRNVNQWHNYKEACLRSQDKLHQWLEKHLQSIPMVITIKDEPVDLDFYEDNVEVISESTIESDLDSINIEDSINNVPNSVHVQILTDDEEDVPKVPAPTKDVDVPTKPEPQLDYDTDCTIEIESVTGSELVPNPLSSNEDRVMEADSTQKSSASTSASKKKIRRGPHTHFRGARVFKQKCVHCQINLHSKYSYAKHMERFHTDKQNGDADPEKLDDEEELIEDLEDELISMEKDAPLTQVQQSIISQLKTFSCYSCQQSFTDRRNTLSHIRQHMPDLRPYTCIACLTEFPDRSMYKLHCGASFECAMKIALVIPNHGEEKYFTCNMCLRSMPNRKDLLSHLSKHSDRQYEELISPSRSPPKLKPMAPLPNLKQEVIRKSHGEGPTIPLPYKNGDPAHNHVCDLCGMIYRYRPNMLKHLDLCQRLSPDVRTSYKCVHCGMTYLVFKKFHNHITLDHKKKDFICSECCSKFRSPSDFLAHHETHRRPRNVKQPASNHEKETKKPVQNITTPIKDWDTFEAEINAAKISDSNQYSCALCNLEFTTRAELTEHRNLHLKVKIYSCVICRSMFSSAGALESHMKDHGIEDPSEQNANSSCVEYGTVEDDSRDSKTINVSATSDPGTNKNECHSCGKMFSNYANLRRHIRNIHKSGKSHFSCPDCSRTFKTKEIRDRHITTEHKALKNMCPKCPKSFVFKGNLNLHFQNAHGEKSRSQTGHKCDLCGKVFLEEASLKIHRSWHSRANSRLSIRFMTNEDKKPAKPLITPKQEQDFNTSSDRPARARKSFPNPPPTKPQGNFQCQVCNDKFSDVTELRKHLWDVHCARNKSEKTFSSDELQCELCTNVYPDRETLNMHMQWHKAYPILSDHSKPTFPCEICGKMYSSKKVLWRHKKLHKATTAASAKFQSMMKKPTANDNLCNICQKVFSSSQSLQRHQLNLHSEIFNQRPPSLYNNSRMSSQDEPKSKKVKVESEESLQKPLSAIDAVHTGKKSVMCHICRKFFPNMSVLYKHKQLMHNKSRVVKNIVKAATTTSSECIPLAGNNGKVCCNICFKEFPGVSNLRQHFTVKHKNSPPQHACPIDGCKLMFPTLQNLKAHEQSHTSMIYSCTLCGKHVFTRTAMTNHMLTVHNTVYDADTNKNFHKETDLTNYVVKDAVDATCPHCKIKYPNNRAMKIHYFKFHDAMGQA